MARPVHAELPDVPANAITGNYDSGANTITWTIPNSYIGFSTANNSTAGYDLPIRLTANVIYPDPPFTAGQSVAVNTDITYTPLGESTPITLDGDLSSSQSCEVAMEKQITLANPNAQSMVDKSISGNTSLHAGETVSYSLDWGNTGNVPLDNFVVEDSIPDYLQLKTISLGVHDGTSPGQTYSLYYKTEQNPTYTLYSSTLSAQSTAAIQVYTTGSSSFNLAANDRVTGIKLEFGTVPPNFGLSSGYFLFTLLDIPNTIVTTNCLKLTTTTTPVNGNQQDCADLTQLPRSDYATPSPYKSYTQGANTSSAYYAGASVGSTVWVRMFVTGYAGQPMINPVVMDLLPLGLTYDGEWQMPASFNEAALPMPTFEHIPNYNNSGRELLRWTWAGTQSTPSASTQVFARVKFTNQAPPGVNITNEYALSADNAQGCYGTFSTYEQDIYDLDGDGSTIDSLCFAPNTSSQVNVAAAAALESEKLVKGQLDDVYTKYPDFGHTTPGGLADYRLKVENVGNIPMTDVIVVDILPWVGDVGVLDPQDRLSEWRPNLAGPVTPPTGVTVYYSTSNNPCRPEFDPNPSTDPCLDWSVTPPVDITTVQSLKFDFGNIVLQPSDSLILSWPMRAPVDAPINGEIAWNSFAYIGTRTDNDFSLLASEPIKVGIQLEPLQPAIYGDYVWLDTNQNGLQDDGATGVSGVRVDLYKDNGDGLSDPATDLWVGFTVTDANGYYLFPSLQPGDYFAVFSPPAGYSVSPSNQGSDDALDSDGVVMPVTNLQSQEDDRTWDLGIYLSPDCDVEISSYTISPCVWNGTSSQVTVNVFITWANAPAGEDIIVTLNGNSQTINVSGSTISPAMVSFTMPANNTDYTINAAFSSTGSCNDSQVIHTPLPCQPNICVLSIDAVNVSACNSGNATVDVVVSWSGAPAGENITVIANGQTQTINVSGGILSPAILSFTVPADGSTNNPITAAFATTSTCLDSDTYNAPVCVTSPDLSLTKSVNTALAQIGDQVTFTLTLTNDNGIDATGVVVSDYLPTGVTFVSSSPIAGVSHSNGTVTWNVGSFLGTDAPKTLDIVVLVNPVAGDNTTGEGVHINNTEITAMNETDDDSTPNNK